MKTFIQIGANIGNDYFFNILQQRKTKARVILVEPNRKLIDQLKTNYQSLTDIHELHFVEGGIVSNKNHNKLNIYTDTNDLGEEISGLSSIVDRKSYSHKLDTISFIPFTFDELCDNFNIREIELLMIDTEGYDYMILNSISLEKYKIRCIICENWVHEIDSDGDIQTGPTFFNNVIRHKFKDFTIKDLDIAHDPNYIFYANT